MGKANVGFPAGGGEVPVGFIGLWSGALNAIPRGWALCNGQNGTPDLRDRFVVGAGSTYAVNAKGGEATHYLATSEMPSHSHGICSSSGRGTLIESATYTESHTDANGSARFWTGYEGGGQAHENRPPYYALCYIMKI